MDRPGTALRVEELLRHADWLRSLARHLVQGGPETDELVQDTWLAALRSPPDPNRPAKPWLTKVVRNFARRRARARALAATKVDEAIASQAAGEIPSPEELLERAELQRLLAGLVLGLPEPYRTTVLLRYYEGRTAEAIALAQAVPAGTVRWRLSEAIRRLREGLDARYGGERRNWALILAPASPTPVWKGAVAVATKAKLGFFSAIALALILTGSAITWRSASDPRPNVVQESRHQTTAGGTVPLGLPRRTLEAWERTNGGGSGGLAGIVRDPEGNPVQGALVAVIPAASYEEMKDKTTLRPRATAVTSKAGDFRLAKVSPGIYLLTATAQGWLPGEVSGLALLPGESRDDIELRLGRDPVMLSGRVHDAGGGPIPGAAVRALALSAGGQPDGARIFVAIADQTGSFALHLQRGGYLVVADAVGYAPTTLKLRLDVDQTRDFRLTPAARISGRVVERGGRPAPGAEVHLQAEGVWASTARSTSTDRAGAYVFDNVPPGTYRLWARLGALTGRTATNVVVAAPGGASDVVIEVLRGLTIAGETIDTQGAPVPGARVAANNGIVVLTDPNGRFEITGLLPGRHELVAESQGHPPARTAVALDAADVDAVKLVLEPESRVYGHVLDRQGQPIAGASVTAIVMGQGHRGESAESASVDRSDEEGRFDLRGLGSGELSIEAAHPRAGRGLAGPTGLAAGTEKKIDIQLGSGAHVRGTVRWDDGEPAAGTIVLGDQRGQPRLTTVTGERGGFDLGPFPPGQVRIGAYPETNALGHGGKGAHNAAVTLERDEVKEGVDLVLPRLDHEISGLVLAPDGSPVDGATVGVSPDHRGVSFRPYNKYASIADGGNYSVLSGVDGSFRLQHLPAGTFTVWATHPDFPEADAYGVVTGSHGVRVRFVAGATLAGYAHTREGKPVTAFTISAMLSHKNDSNPELRATRGYVQQTLPIQDSGGGFQVTGLHAARYDLLVTTPDGRGGRLADIPLAAGETKEDLRIIVGPGARVRGQVVDASTHKGVTGATVAAWLAMLVTETKTTSTTDGTFLIPDVVPGGAVQLSVRGHRGYKLKFQTLDVPVGAEEVDVGAIRVEPIVDSKPALKP